MGSSDLIGDGETEAGAARTRDVGLEDRRVQVRVDPAAGVANAETTPSVDLAHAERDRARRAFQRVVDQVAHRPADRRAVDRDHGPGRVGREQEPVAFCRGPLGDQVSEEVPRRDRVVIETSGSGSGRQEEIVDQRAEPGDGKEYCQLWY